MSVVLGLDVGTTGARAIAVDEAGRPVAEASVAYPMLTPRPGWTEQDPEEWWRAVNQVLSRVAGEAGAAVAGLGLTGQMHGAVFLDERDKVIRPALLWNDQRTEAQCLEITQRVGRDRLLEVAGNPAPTGFQAPKVLWLRDNEPDNFQRVAHVLLPKDFIRLRLAGERATDASDAAGTLLLDLRRRAWSPELLEALELPPEWFPTVLESPEVSGRLSADVAAELGLPAGIPWRPARETTPRPPLARPPSPLARSAAQSGPARCSSPTAGMSPDPAGRLHAFCHAVPGAYHLMGVTLAAGGSLRWWREMLAVRLDCDARAALAASAPPGSDGLLFLPYLSGERTPHLDPSARGAFFGLTIRHDASHLTRAVMEGVVFSLKDCLELMVGLGLRPEQVRAVGGGARNLLWRQLQADIFGLPVVQTEVDEGPAYGAALLAAVAARWFGSIEEACSVVRVRPEPAEPDAARMRLVEERYDIYRSLYPATAEAMHALASAG